MWQEVGCLLWIEFSYPSLSCAVSNPLTLIINDPPANISISILHVGENEVQRERGETGREWQSEEQRPGLLAPSSVPY